MNTPTKRCRTCGQEFPATPDFFYRTGWKDYLVSDCKRCYCLSRPSKPRPSKKGQKPRYKPPIIDGKKQCTVCKEWKFLDEFSLKKDSDYRSNCKACGRIKTANWRANNRERHRAYSRQYAEDHQDEVREKNRYRIRKYYQDGFGRLVKQRRKARKKELLDTLTPRDWQHALDYFNGCCAACGKPPGLWHMIVPDHWIPLASHDCPGTIPQNIVPLCHGQDGCNNAKRDKKPEQWLTEQFGKRKAQEILKKIKAYFVSL